MPIFDLQAGEQVYLKHNYPKTNYLQKVTTIQNQSRSLKPYQIVALKQNLIATFNISSTKNL